MSAVMENMPPCTAKGAQSAGSVRARLAARMVTLTPGDPGYDEARTVWNAMVDKRPRIIARCATSRDRDGGPRRPRPRPGNRGPLRRAQRAGPGRPRGRADDRPDPDGRGAGGPGPAPGLVQGGALLGALDRAAQRHGLATTAGNVSHTGVGGLTLGGGMGWLARQYGLACDNVISYQVVTADGRQLRASRTEHPDLYWALRGGAATSALWLSRVRLLHPAGTRALVAEHTFGAGHAAAALRAWRDLAARRAVAGHVHRNRPRRAGHGRLGVGGRPAAAAGVLARQLDALGVRLLTRRVAETSYLDLQCREDTLRGHAVRRYWKGHYLRTLSDEAIGALLQGRGECPGREPAGLRRGDRRRAGRRDRVQPPRHRLRVRRRRELDRPCRGPGADGRRPLGAPGRSPHSPAAHTSTCSATTAPTACAAPTPHRS